MNANNETYVVNEISNRDSSNTEDTYTLTITSSNSNVEFVYTDDAVLSNISVDDIAGKIFDLVDKDQKTKVKKLTGEEVISDSFEKEYTIANNKKVTFTIVLRSKTYNTESTDLTYTLSKDDETIQTLVRHITVVGKERDVPQI